MTKQNRATLIDQIRQAVENSDLTRYAISKKTGIHQASLSRFVYGERGLSDDALNSLGELLNLEIVVRNKRKGN
jgi:cyanate lyase